MSSKLSLLKLIDGEPLYVSLHKISGDDPPAEPILCTYTVGEYTAEFDIEGIYKVFFTDGDGDDRHSGYVELVDRETVNEVYDRIRDLANLEVEFDRFADEFAISVPAFEADDIANGLDSEIKRYAGSTWKIAVIGMTAHPSKLYMTIKRGTESDENAVMQIVVSNPTDAADGLIVYRSEPADDKALASIAVSSYDDNGTTKYKAIATITAAVTDLCPDRYRLDFKETDTPNVVSEAALIVAAGVTDATS